MKAAPPAHRRAHPSTSSRRNAGCPSALPEGERILWQGQPAAGLVARRVFHLPALALYFAVLLAWRLAVLVVNGGSGLLEALRGSLGQILLLGHRACDRGGAGAADVPRTTVYTLTDKRVVMRIGIVLTVTYNLPLRSIDAARLVRLGQGCGDIALRPAPATTRIAYLHAVAACAALAPAAHAAHAARSGAGGAGLHAAQRRVVARQCAARGGRARATAQPHAGLRHPTGVPGLGAGAGAA
jgi:hypothetical protein